MHDGISRIHRREEDLIRFGNLCSAVDLVRTDLETPLLSLLFQLLVVFVSFDLDPSFLSNFPAVHGREKSTSSKTLDPLDGLDQIARPQVKRREDRIEPRYQSQSQTARELSQLERVHFTARVWRAWLPPVLMGPGGVTPG